MQRHLGFSFEIPLSCHSYMSSSPPHNSTAAFSSFNVRSPSQFSTSTIAAAQPTAAGSAAAYNLQSMGTTQQQQQESNKSYAFNQTLMDPNKTLTNAAGADLPLSCQQPQKGGESTGFKIEPDSEGKFSSEYSLLQQHPHQQHQQHPHQQHHMGIDGGIRESQEQLLTSQYRKY